MDLLKSLKAVVNTENVRTDNNVFRLHYKFTAAMLLIFSIVLTSKQYFGNPIVCHTEHKYKDVIEAYCFLQGTFVLPDNVEAKDVPLLGNEVGNKRSWQEYYQWIPIVFCIQALCFYFPYYLWKTWEAGHMQYLVKDIDGPVTPAAWTKSKKEALINYITSDKCLHSIYSGRYVLCEILNLLNVVGQIYFLDWLLTNQFSSYGLTIFKHSLKNVMLIVFPIRAKCNYTDFGAGGSVQVHDSMCILSLNVLNQRLFMVIWFWFLLLTALSSVALLYRFILLLFPKIRTYLLVVQTKSIDMKKLAFLIKRLAYGNFFILYNIGKNVNPILYSELVLDLYEKEKKLSVKKKEDFEEV